MATALQTQKLIKSNGGDTRVLDCTLVTLEDHARDLPQRLDRQLKALARAKSKAYAGIAVIEDSIHHLQITIDTVNGLLAESVND